MNVEGLGCSMHIEYACVCEMFVHKARIVCIFVEWESYLWSTACACRVRMCACSVHTYICRVEVVCVWSVLSKLGIVCVLQVVVHVCELYSMIFCV